MICCRHRNTTVPSQGFGILRRKDEDEGTYLEMAAWEALRLYFKMTTESHVKNNMH